MSFEAKNNIVILKLTHEEKITEGGIVIPLRAQKVPDQGVVVSAGPGKYADNGTLVRHGISVGDTVSFSKPHAHGVFIEDVEYVYVDADHVHAIVGS